MSNKPEKNIEQFIREDGRFPLEAVQFVREALHHAVEKYHPDPSGPSGQRHVSGAQLCEGIREVAMKRWGLMARPVLHRWNITTTRDFGEIVFLLVSNGWLQKESSDNIDDFNDVYDFAEVFEHSFEMPLGD